MDHPARQPHRFRQKIERQRDQLWWSVVPGFPSQNGCQERFEMVMVCSYGYKLCTESLTMSRQTWAQSSKNLELKVTSIGNGSPNFCQRLVCQSEDPEKFWSGVRTLHRVEYLFGVFMWHLLAAGVKSKQDRRAGCSTHICHQSHFQVQILRALRLHAYRKWPCHNVRDHQPFDNDDAMKPTTQR